MAEVLEAPRPRINAGLVADFTGRAVCLVGRMQKIHPTGTSFIVSDGDGKNVTVEMTDPLEEELSGVIEVVGKVTQKATIKAAYYTPFREDKNSFDLGLYNEAVCILHEFSQYYPFGVTSNS
ncbi:replication protein A 14 kDa subunit [Pristis pectinata]|uniref:replication protein A 14 kDa subunit n=1 Tax=Pristis pectinata TaxID=685728 RepID=UPI00223CE14B|nr:replication protein A 14 kDa subunit [Pristis pectinata]